MSVNKYGPHVYVLPEDDANRQLAIGFVLELSLLASISIKVLPVAGGWINALESFKADHVDAMNKYPSRFMVVLIDIDGRDDRLKQAKTAIPGHLIDRVFILGVWTEPEDLKAEFGTYEETDSTWAHPLLQHNAGEIERARDHVRPILLRSR